MLWDAEGLGGRGGGLGLSNRQGREVTPTGPSSLPVAPKSSAILFRVMKSRAGNGLSQQSDANRNRVASQPPPRPPGPRAFTLPHSLHLPKIFPRKSATLNTLISCYSLLTAPLDSAYGGYLFGQWITERTHMPASTQAGATAMLDSASSAERRA